MEGQTLELGEVRLHHLEWNPDSRRGPAVLLLHGLSSNAHFWKRVADRLPGRHVVALDQRSHGSSSAPEHGYLPQTLAADAAALIRRLDLGRTVVVGHSWGASIALELAVDCPELVAGLVIVDGPIRPWSERGLTWEEAASFMQPPLPAYTDLDQAVVERRSLLKENWGEDLVEFIHAGLREDADGLHRLPLTAPVRRQILHSMFFQPYDIQWTQVGCPVLIALAESGAPFLDFKRSSAQQVVDAVPGTVVHWYPTGHDIPLEDPTGIAEDIERTCLRSALADVTRGIIDVVQPAEEIDLTTRSIYPVEPAANASGAAQWTARDLLAHLTSTQAALPEIVRTAGTAAARDGAAIPFNNQRWNASQVSKRANTPVADLLAELTESLAATDRELADLALSAVVSIGTFAGSPVGEAMRLMIDHQKVHLVELRDALSAGPSQAGA